MGKFVATNDESYLVLKQLNQDSSETDWGKVIIDEKVKSPANYNTTDTTNTELYFDNESDFEVNENIFLYDGNNSSILKIDNINKHIVYGYGETDYFEDGSCILKLCFDDSLDDETGNYTPSGSNVGYTDGRFGRCLNCNSTTIDTGLPQNSLTDSFSISTWANASSLGNYYGIAGYHNYGCSDCGINFGQFITDHLDFSIAFEGTWYGIQVSQSDFTLNDWHHIVMVINKISNKYQLYFDNNLWGEIDISGDFSPANCNIIIGRAFDSSDRYWHGLIDTFEVYNKPLSSGEVDLLYNVSPNSKTNKFYIDISSLNFSNAPVKVHKLNKIKYRDKDPNNTNTISNLYIKEKVDENNPVDKQDKLIVYNHTDGYKELSPLIILKTKNSYDNLVDILNDGSCKFFVNFENTVNDLTGTYTGTWSGTEQYVDGIHGKAAKFDGNSYIEYSPNLPDMQNITISCFVQILNLDGTQNLFFDGDTSSGHDFELRMHSDKSANFNVKDDGLNFTLPDDLFTKMSHLCLIVGNGFIKIYVNKNLIASKNYSGNGNTGYHYKFQIGRLFDGSNNMYYFKGIVDTFRIFDKAISESEIDYLYSNDGKKYISKNINISSLNLTEIPKRYYFISSKSIVSFKENENEANLTNIEYEIDPDGSTDSELVIIDNTEKYRRIDKFDTDDTFDNIVTSKDNYNITINNNDNNLVCFLDFNNNYTDKKSNFNITLNGTEQYESYHLGKCFKFNGNTYLEFDTYNFNCTDLTLSFWSKLVSLSGTQTFYHFSKNDENTWAMYHMNNIIEIDIGSQSNVFSVKDHMNMVHYVLTANGNIYMNGILVASNLYNIDLSVMNRNFVLGADRDSGGLNDFLNGLIGNFRVYNKILNDNEALNLYLEESNKFIYTNNIITYFNFNQSLEDKSERYHLSLTTGTEQYEENNNKQFLKFDGNTYYDSSDIDLSGESIITISFLTMIQDFTRDLQVFLNIGSDTNNGIGIIYWNDGNGHKAFGINTYQSDVWGIDNTDIYLNKINHYIIEVHSNDIPSTRIWINGNELQTSQIIGTYQNRSFASGFRLGCDYNNNSLIGIIRNLRIYSGSMESNINNIYKDGFDFYKYKLTLQNTLSSIPNKIYIKPNITHLLEIDSLVNYDSANDIVNYKYKDLEPIYTGRSFQLKHQLSKQNDEFYGCNINFWKLYN